MTLSRMVSDVGVWFLVSGALVLSEANAGLGNNVTQGSDTREGSVYLGHIQLHTVYRIYGPQGRGCSRPGVSPTGEQHAVFHGQGQQCS